MNAREKTGLLQHVAQHAANFLTSHYFGGYPAAVFEAGMGIDLVIDLYGENNARAGGSGEAKATAERGEFLPGIDVAGGSLLPISADSKWRSEKGRDRFVRALRKGQRDGAKAAAKQELGKIDPLAFFALESERGRAQLVCAPFLGTEVGEKAVREDALAEYREFFRAYKSAFAYWLRTQARPAGAKREKQPFAQLLRTCAAPPQGRTFEQVVEELYGLPLSASDRTVESLEWRFLRWLSRQ
jgi:hypothetical protein